MPFKSKAQQRFMFAAEDRGDVPKGTARRWAHHTPDIKKLPEHKKHEKKAELLRKLAFDLGKCYALATIRAEFLNAPLEKTAIPIPANLGEAFWKYLPILGPAAAGAYLAGPGYRLEGAAGGALAGHTLGRGAGLRMGLKQIPEAAKLLEGGGRPEQILRMLRSGAEGAPKVTVQQLAELERAGGIGAAAMGAGGGYATGRLLGLQNPYGLQPVFAGAGRENPLGVRPE